MIQSKIAAVRLLRQFREISENLGGTLTDLDESASALERRSVAQPITKLLGAIECDLYSPILAEHPMLRPVELLGSRRASARYRLMYCLGEGTPEEQIAGNLTPDEAELVLERHESEKQGIFWLELTEASGLFPLSA